MKFKPTIPFISPLITAIICCSLLSSCEWIQNSIEETKQVPDKTANYKNKSSSHSSDDADEQIEQEEQQSLMFPDSSKLKAIQTSLRELPKFKGKDIIFIPVIVFYEYQGGYVSLSIQDPDNKENLDEYIYEDGAWQPSKPVNTSVRSYWKEKLFNLNKVNFATVTKIYKTAMEKVESIEGAEKITHIFLSDQNNELRWHFSIQGARRNYTLYFNLDGELLSFEEQ